MSKYPRMFPIANAYLFDTSDYPDTAIRPPNHFSQGVAHYLASEQEDTATELAERYTGRTVAEMVAIATQGR